jgi:hypothetical protein
LSDKQGRQAAVVADADARARRREDVAQREEPPAPEALPEPRRRRHGVARARELRRDVDDSLPRRRRRGQEQRERVVPAADQEARVGGLDEVAALAGRAREPRREPGAAVGQRAKSYRASHVDELDAREHERRRAHGLEDLAP